MHSDFMSSAKAWPIVEARKLVDRFGTQAPSKGFVLFETGYGPSGLPHIGTFGEVFRTTMVRQAFARMSDIPTKLIAFSDDMDGLRKVPTNLPNQDMVAEHLGKPLTDIPDPFGTHESFGAHMNNRLQQFLDRFGFDYEFCSATDAYKSGRFNDTLLRMLAAHDKVWSIVTPHLRDERRQSYSPFLPVCKRTGQVLQVNIEETHPDRGTLVYLDPETGDRIEQSVLDGQCKLQWRADWAMRWTALEVDYEMYGKDLIDSANLSGKIARTVGGSKPEGFVYEMFLDENAEKISKSKGNGLSLDEWLTYGNEQSLALYMYQQPRKAKRLYFDVIPKHVDEYQAFLTAFPGQDEAKQLGNPVWHLHNGAPPAANQPVSFAMLLNLANVANAETAAELWAFVGKYVDNAGPDTHPELDRLMTCAIAYYRDFVKPAKAYRLATSTEHAAMTDLLGVLESMDSNADAQALQEQVYEVGKRHEFENLRDWFKALYEVLLGQSAGPRFGSFIEIYGIANTRQLIVKALDEKLASSESEVAS